jgi:hypothetical protein
VTIPGGAELLRQLISSAEAHGHHSTLRESSDETVAYWATRTKKLGEQVAKLLDQCQTSTPPEGCRQRLAAEGKPYPRSSCAVCGKFSPRWKECDAALARRPAPSLDEARADSERLDFVAKHLVREAQIRLPEGVRDCWAWAVSSATPDLRAAIDAVRAATKEGSSND